MKIAEAAQLVGIPYRTAAWWAEIGLVRIDGGTGKGRRAEITDKHLAEFRNIVRLRDAGLSLQAIRGIADELRARGYNPLSSGLFAVVDGTPGKESVVRIGNADEAAIELRGKHAGQLLLFVPLDLIENTAPERAA